MLKALSLRIILYHRHFNMPVSSLRLYKYEHMIMAYLEMPEPLCVQLIFPHKSNFFSVILNN
jgi:hypothetical protein